MNQRAFVLIAAFAHVFLTVHAAKKKKEKEERERRGLPEKEEEKKFNGSTVNQPFL